MLTSEQFHELEEHGMVDADLNRLRLDGLSRLGDLTDRGFGILVTQMKLWQWRRAP